MKPLDVILPQPIKLTFWVLFAFLWVNFLYGAWPPMKPIFWPLFLRSGGPFLYANHVSSEIAIMGVASWFAVRHRPRAISWVLVVLSTASIHEIFVAVDNLLIGTDYFNVESEKYMIYVSILLLIGLIFATKRQRKTLTEVTLIIVLFELFWNVCIIGFHLDTQTINGFVMGSAFWDWRENALEVLSWVLPSVWWLVRWKDE